jgi:hypothetical protein
MERLPPHPTRGEAVSTWRQRRKQRRDEQRRIEDEARAEVLDAIDEVRSGLGDFLEQLRGAETPACPFDATPLTPETSDDRWDWCCPTCDYGFTTEFLTAAHPPALAQLDPG